MTDDEGYGLDDGRGEEDNKGEQEGKEGEEQEKEDITTDYNINLIISERNKLHHEINIRVPEYNERIGRLNLDLFGDPRNQEWESKLDVLNEELDHPMTKSHPIANKTRAVVKEIKDLQLEYKALHKFYSRYVKEIGTLLDETIKLYKQAETMPTPSESSEKPSEAELSVPQVKRPVITIAVVEKLMTKFDGQRWIDEYIKGYDSGNYFKARSAKGAFIMKAKAFFKGFHDDPKLVATKVFDKYAGTRVLKKDILKKIKEVRNPEKTTEQDTADKAGLIDLEPKGDGKKEEGKESK